MLKASVLVYLSRFYLHAGFSINLTKLMDHLFSHCQFLPALRENSQFYSLKRICINANLGKACLPHSPQMSWCPVSGSKLINWNKHSHPPQTGVWHCSTNTASQAVLVVKSPSASAGDLRETGSLWSLGLEDPQEEAVVAHSSILTWRIPWTEDPGGL